MGFGLDFPILQTQDQTIHMRVKWIMAPIYEKDYVHVYAGDYEF